MLTWIYKSVRKADTFLYLAREDDFTPVPSPLLDLMGPLEPVLKVDLSTRERLARVDIHEVRAVLQEQGYFVQLAPGELPPATTG